MNKPTALLTAALLGACKSSDPTVFKIPGEIDALEATYEAGLSKAVRDEFKGGGELQPCNDKLYFRYDSSPRTEPSGSDQKTGMEGDYVVTSGLDSSEGMHCVYTGSEDRMFCQTPLFRYTGSELITHGSVYALCDNSNKSDEEKNEFWAQRGYTPHLDLSSLNTQTPDGESPIASTLAENAQVEQIYLSQLETITDGVARAIEMYDVNSFNRDNLSKKSWGRDHIFEDKKVFDIDGVRYTVSSGLYRHGPNRWINVTRDSGDSIFEFSASISGKPGESVMGKVGERFGYVVKGCSLSCSADRTPDEKLPSIRVMGGSNIELVDLDEGSDSLTDPHEIELRRIMLEKVSSISKG